MCVSIQLTCKNDFDILCLHNEDMLFIIEAANMYEYVHVCMECKTKSLMVICWWLQCSVWFNLICRPFLTESTETNVALM